MPSSPLSNDSILALRASSRLLVRELGIMSSTAAGTSLSPSAIHALIEIGASDDRRETITAGKLCEVLCLEKSSVSRMLRKLIEGGEVEESFGRKSADGREKVLGLTDQGRDMLGVVDTFARVKITSAFSHLASPHTPTSITYAFSAYAHALRADRHKLRPPPASPQPRPLSLPNPTLTIQTGYIPGLLAAFLSLSMSYYPSAIGVGFEFETQLGASFSDLITRLDGTQCQVWSVVDEQKKVMGTVWIDGDMVVSMGDNADQEVRSGKRVAQLRGFIVGEDLRGMGWGKRLLEEAALWLDGRGFDECHLWALMGWKAVERVYGKIGFTVVEEKEEVRWGRELVIQHAIRMMGGKKVESVGKVEMDGVAEVVV